MNKFLSFLATIVIGCGIWILPKPQEVTPEAWHLFAIFAATVAGIILKPFPMGIVAILALTVSILTNTLSFTQAFSGFINEIVWLIVFAFFIARAFISSGLGHRIAYHIMYLIGQHALGLGYGLVATDLIIAPMIPSQTARGGGISYPLIKALAEIFSGPLHDPKMNAFLTLCAFQGIGISGAMFLTAMAGNPLIAGFARSEGIAITWTNWFVAAIVPGLISLAIVPYAIYRLVSPTIRYTPHAKQMAREKLLQMGPMKREEWITLCTFFLLIILWVGENWIHLSATVAAMIGLCILFLTNVLKWKQVIEEQSAWDTFIWFSVLITLPKFLNQYGFTAWFSESIVHHISGFDWRLGFFLIILIYFYVHYFFASNVGQIGALYAPFLAISIALGAPPLFAALMLGFLSNLYGGLTHYGSAPAPILFGTGFVTIGQWWKVGAMIGVINLIIWIGFGGLWWKLIGIW